jgi:hypothetical protein
MDEKNIKRIYKFKKDQPDLYVLLEPLFRFSLCKGEIEEEINKLQGFKLHIDYAIPQHLYDDLINQGIDPTFYVYDYTHSNLGKPLNLVEKYFSLLVIALTV